MLTRILVTTIVLLWSGCSLHEFNSGTEKHGDRSAAAGPDERQDPNKPKDLSEDYPDGILPAADGDGPRDPNSPTNNGIPHDPFGNPNDPNNPGGGKPNDPISTPPFPPGPIPNPPKSGGPEKKVVDLTVNCSNGSNPVKPVLNVEETKDKKVTSNLFGEFCPAADNNMGIIFLIDFSGSMGKHNVPGGGQIGHPGHDPLQDGSCGRYEAVKTILEKAKASGPVDVQVAMVPFAGGIVTPYAVNLTNYDNFVNQYVKPDHICRFVLQYPDTYAEYPGAIKPTAAYNASTQFDPPLTRARQLVNGINRTTRIYFITDGEPTDPNSGKSAAQQLAGVPNITVNSLLLTHDAANARAVLEALTPNGGADRVKDVANAKDLKVVIEQFEDPTLDVKRGGAKLMVQGYPVTEIGLVPLTNGDLLRKFGDVYRYQVQPFVLLGRPGEIVSNYVNVWAKGTDGKDYLTTFEVRYHMLP